MSTMLFQLEPDSVLYCDGERRPAYPFLEPYEQALVQADGLNRLLQHQALVRQELTKEAR